MTCPLSSGRRCDGTTWPPSRGPSAPGSRPAAAVQPPVCGLGCRSEAARQHSGPQTLAAPASQASSGSGVGDRFLHLVGKVACFRTVVSFRPQPCCGQPFVPVTRGVGGTETLQSRLCCQLTRWPFFLLRALSASFSSPGADFQT